MTIGSILLMLFVVPTLRKGIFDIFRGKTGTEAMADPQIQTNEDAASEQEEYAPYDASETLPLDEVLKLFKSKITTDSNSNV
jgi:hypothetical protein